MYDMLVFYSAQPESAKTETFTMLPLQKGFQLKHIPIDSQALAHLVQFTILNRKKTNPNFCYRINNIDFHSVNLKTFEQDPEAIWNRFFNTNHSSTRNRKFAFYITTNGYACSLHLNKPTVPCPFQVEPSTTGDKSKKKRKYVPQEEERQQEEKDLIFQGNAKPKDWSNYTYYDAKSFQANHGKYQFRHLRNIRPWFPRFVHRHGRRWKVYARQQR